MTPKLKVLHGKNAGHEIRLKGSQFLIGRGEECQLRPKSDAISRQHCEFTIEGGQVSVKDLGSKNGTLVNGTRIESDTSLNDGDEIQIGKLAFTIVGLAVEEPAELEKPAAKKEKPAAMFTDQSIEDSDISAWLQEGDDSNRARELAEPETKQFNLKKQTATHYMMRRSRPMPMPMKLLQRMTIPHPKPTLVRRRSSLGNFPASCLSARRIHGKQPPTCSRNSSAGANLRQALTRPACTALDAKLRVCRTPRARLESGGPEVVPGHVPGPTPATCSMFCIAQPCGC